MNYTIFSRISYTKYQNSSSVFLAKHVIISDHWSKYICIIYAWTRPLKVVTIGHCKMRGRVSNQVEFLDYHENIENLHGSKHQRPNWYTKTKKKRKDYISIYNLAPLQILDLSSAVLGLVLVNRSKRNMIQNTIPGRL